MSESRLNIELFKKIREKIATTPEAYDQLIWGRVSARAPCGTAGCIAGWACVLNENASLAELRIAGRDGEIDETGRHVSDLAQTALRLTDEEVDVLFTSSPEGEWEDYDDDGNDLYGGGWPEPFGARWRRATSDAECAQVAVAYLDHIIETGKVLE